MSTNVQRRVKCHPYVKLSARQDITWTVPNICAAYHWPNNLNGGGVIAIVELGGGWVVSDMQRYFATIGQPMPTITDISVDGTQNTNQRPHDPADMEVALDIQVAAASYFVATGKPADIRVYWAQDIAVAVAKAAADGCDVCSISWGADEAAWGAAAADDMNTTAMTANMGGMVIFAAAGDNDSSDGGPDSANVDCPASCLFVLACGGTSKTMTDEVVWNNNPGATNGNGTGGGYSTLFTHPKWQRANGAPLAPVRLPDDKNPGTGRMVPDISANADPHTGYTIVVRGQEFVVGGTSAVAPLFAGLFAAIGTKLGFISHKLWVHHGAWTDILTGNNGDYAAKIGPDPVSGLGVPIGVKISALF